MAHITVTPAYGRDYKSKAAILADWNADMDFTLQPDGCYINRPQVESGEVNVRYSRMTKVAVLFVRKDGTWAAR